MRALFTGFIEAVAEAQLPHAVLPQAAFLGGDFDGEVHTLQTRPGGGLRSEEHTSELQSLMRISYAVFCLKKKTPHQQQQHTRRQQQIAHIDKNIKEYHR